MFAIQQVLTMIKDMIWSPPLLILIIGVGIYLTILLKGVQFRYLRYAFRQVFTKRDAGSVGDISHFEALATTLAGAIGTGSITGVAAGVAVGGMGAIFWIWVTALFGMAIKYAEGLLAIKYRVADKNNEMVGGPMEYIERGLGWKWLAVLFAIFGAIAAIGTGNLVQVNSIGDAVTDLWAVSPWITGVVLAALTGLVLIGGVRSIGHVAGVLVPVMAVFYLISGCVILLYNFAAIPEALQTIFVSAFSGQAAVGGFLGSTIMVAMRVGVARSVFSSEAGLGISSIAAAAAKTDHPGRQAMINMTGVLFSTMVVCTITGLVIGVTGVLGHVDVNGKVLSGVPLAIKAFKTGVSGGGYVVTIGLILFAYSTVIAWAYYGEKCFEYLFGERAIIIYRVLFTVIIIPGAALDMEFVWTIADISNGLMVFPNLVAIVALSGVIAAETRSFLEIAQREIREDRNR